MSFNWKELTASLITSVLVLAAASAIVVTALFPKIDDVEKSLTVERNVARWAEQMNVDVSGFVCNKTTGPYTVVQCDVSVEQGDGAVQLYSVDCETRESSRNSCFLSSAK